MFRLALPPPRLSSAMRQGGQPWPDWNGTLQQMWERACPAKRRAGGARSAHHRTTQAMHPKKPKAKNQKSRNQRLSLTS